MLLGRAGRLHVAGRIEIGGERLHRVVDVAARRAWSRPFLRARALRRRRNRQAARRPGPCRRPARSRRGRPWRSRRGGGRTRQSRRGCLWPPRERGSRSARRRGPSAVSNRPLKKSSALTVRLPLVPGDLDLAAERQQARRQFGRRIGEGDRAAERAAVADRRMADMRHGERDQRRVPGDLGGALGLDVAGQRADLDCSRFSRRCRQARRCHSGRSTASAPTAAC